MKKLLAILLAIVMVMGLATTAMAQSVDSGKGGNATITIENASKGETYKIVKIFDASVTGEVDGSIAYTGTIPAARETVFEKDSADKILAHRLCADPVCNGNGNEQFCGVDQRGNS